MGRQFVPPDLSGLKLWLRADTGITTYTTAITGAGTSVSQSGTTLTGISTLFTTEVVVGDTITAGGGMSGTVTAIASATSLTLSSSATISAQSPYTITPVLGASERVTTWADQSGSGYDATQSTVSKKPARIPNVQNGRQGIWFDGPNGSLSLTGPTTTTSFSMFLVIRPIASSDTYGCLWVNTGSVGLYYMGGSPHKLDYYHSVTDHLSNTGMTEDAAHLIAVICNAGAATFYLEGVADGTVSSVPSADVLQIGDDPGSENYKGYLLEMVIYNNTLNAANRLQVENYLRSLYATP